MTCLKPSSPLCRLRQGSMKQQEARADASLLKTWRQRGGSGLLKIFAVFVGLASAMVALHFDWN
eukprot:7281101-Karenia_brevis.AAC.1